MAARLPPPFPADTTPATFPDLDGASVFVTGGGSGIGAALTEGFLRQGAKVAFIGRSDASGFVAAMADATGTAPLFLQGDVTDTDRLRAALDEAAAAQGPIEVLVNNAASDMRFATPAITRADWQAQIDLNLGHQFFAAQHVANAMVAARVKGRIVNLSSITYQMGAGGMLPYMTAKAGILGLTRALARDYGPQGIRVNALAPGMVLTDRQLRDWIDDDGIRAHVATQCLPNRILPEAMVGPVLFLSSAASTVVTGQCLIADGGVEFAA